RMEVATAGPFILTKLTRTGVLLPTALTCGYTVSVPVPTKGGQSTLNVTVVSPSFLNMARCSVLPIGVHQDARGLSGASARTRSPLIAPKRLSPAMMSLHFSPSSVVPKVAGAVDGS